MKKYVVERKNVYAGILMKPLDITVPKYESIYNGLSPETKKEIKRCGRKLCCIDTVRPILFRIEEGLAKDLYDSKEQGYPVASIEHKKGVLSDCIVERIANLEDLLTYLQYPEFLSKRDMKKIHRLLVESSAWLQAHRELFGYKEVLEDVWIQESPPQISCDIYETLREIHKIPESKRRKLKRNKAA